MSAAKTPRTPKTPQSERKPKIIHLEAQPATRDQLLRLPTREDEEYSAGDLIWAKVRSFPLWPGLITVDPVSGSYSDVHGNKKVFHFQYFGNTPYRGFTEGKVWKYEGREKYEQKLEQMRTELKSTKNKQLQNELKDLEVKKSKADWLVACEQADEAMKLSRAERIKTLTFEYVGPRSRVAGDESDEEESAKPKSKLSTPKPRKSTNDLKRSVSKASGLKTPASKRKKKAANSSPTDVYDFNESSSDEDEQPAKFELSSAKRAKGEFALYEKQMRASVEKDNPKLSQDEIDQKLRRNWELMSEDMRNSYAPRTSQFTNQTNGKETPKTRRSSLKKSLPVFTTEDEPEVHANGNAEPEPEPEKKSVSVGRASRSSARFKTPLKAANEPTPTATPTSSSENHKKEESPASTPVTNNTNNNLKSNSIKSKSSGSNQLDENGVSEDSLSCSSDEKTEQQKEQLCGKCGKLDKGLIPCEGECLDFFHKECLHEESAAN